MDLWMKFAETVGLPGVLVIGLAVGVWRMLVWTGEHIVRPIVDSMQSFLRTHAEHYEQQTKLLAELKNAAEHHQQMAAAHMASCELIASRGRSRVVADGSPG